MSLSSKECRLSLKGQGKSSGSKSASYTDLTTHLPRVRTVSPKEVSHCPAGMSSEVFKSGFAE